MFLAVGLHLEEDRLVEATEPFLHVGLDPRVDDLHTDRAYPRTSFARYTIAASRVIGSAYH